MIALDPDAQELALRRIVTLLNATRPIGHADSIVIANRQRVLEAIDSYRAAVVELVLEGQLDVDQGIQLDEIVERIIAGEP
jgi:hypothetical protein